ncbi:MAG TPA: PHB depolymerase family esterase [Usitatibacter sp.]|nr:PHB depolymerase family esterase [Usitatibacter sp.]
MLRGAWKRVRGFFARLFGRAPPAPGRFERGSKFALAGRLAAAPWIWPAREYLVYVPRGHGRWRRYPLVVMIHGCKQTPEEFAAATRIAALADEQGWLLLLPRQEKKANPWSCWNWFDIATGEGRGEAAIVAAQVRAVRRHYRVHPRRVFLAGFSAGGGLAAALGVRHPQLFAGVFIHSGLPCASAAGPSAATKVMKNGAKDDPARVGIAARSMAGDVALPLVVLHGGRDDVVAPINATQLVRQFLALNGLDPASEPEVKRSDAGAGRVVETSDYRAAGRIAVRLVSVPQLGHAWSGGDESHPYNDARPPDAARLIAEMVEGR